MQQVEFPRLKICGITTLEDARFAAGAMADYLGFLFYPGSPRYLSPRKAAEISGWIEGPEKVGV
ncbi:MAG: phosphoribosylanthranilate isomerase, partial [Bacteroidota bacterium]